ncbi:MAG: NAD+ synthase, partial [Gammaproteobacteria bacterium]
KENPLPVLYVNLVGGQDELVFDGDSFVMDAAGKVCFRAPAFDEEVFISEFKVADNGKVTPVPGKVAEPHSEVETTYQALVLGVRDYVEKNRFPGLIIGLSGGIDSGLTLAIAVDAIGPERVEAVMMPSRYTSQISLEDAKKEAQNLGVRYHELSIEPVFQAALDVLREEFAGKAVDTTEENIQARCRGMMLMALSNKSGKLVLTTGNKSEMAVGYATLYGDMAGGFNALKDVPKTLVYRLAEYRNTRSPVIPQRVIHRAPSAELAPDQKDSDSLPDYGELDGILELFVEQDKSIAEIVNAGYDRTVVEQVIKMVDLNEYKRRQAAPGVRITRRAFSRDRRVPITSGFKSFS